MQARYALFWDITWCRVVNPYWHIRATYQSHLQGAINVCSPCVERVRYEISGKSL